MKNDNTKKFNFVVGATIHVFETKGCRELKGGPSSSERTGGEYADIEPSEDLKVLKKLGSDRAIVERADGSHVLVHHNHFNAEASYYALRGQKLASQKPVAQRISEKKADLERMMAEMKGLMEQQAKLEAAQAELEAETAPQVSDEAREEAAALFAEANA